MFDRERNMTEARIRLAEYDRVHGTWNRDRHRYERNPMYTLQHFCPELAKGENHDGWLTLIRFDTEAEAIKSMNRPMHDGRKRQLRIVEVDDQK